MAKRRTPTVSGHSPELASRPFPNLASYKSIIFGREWPEVDSHTAMVKNRWPETSRMLHGCARRAALLRVVPVCLVFCSSLLFAQADSARVWAEWPVVKLADTGEVEFVAIADLAEQLDLRTYYSEKARKVILYVGESEVKVTAMNPFVQVGDRLVQMPLEARLNDDDILVPLPFFLDLIRPLTNGKLTPAPKTVSAPRPVHRGASISSVLLEEKANGTLIRIATTRSFARKHITTRLSRGWLYLDIYGGRIDGKTMSAARPAGIVRRVSAAQSGSLAQISLQLKQDIDQRKIGISGQNAEILISLPSGEPLSADFLKSLEDERKKWLIDTIVIDAGHGGADPGAIGATGTNEKDITLDIAKRVKKLLENSLDVRVVMTRESDKKVPLKDRTALANSEQGKLFISIHCNSNRSQKMTGFTTYILGLAKTEEALESSRRENAVINYEADSSAYAHLKEEGFILNMLAQNSYMRESEELAALVQSEMDDKLSVPNRGVKQAGFYVLIGASMPCILVETAFISNQKEEKLLRADDFQQKVAEAIFGSVKKFKDKYEWGI
jgi:N-acetylmuramoyl-L-alanine amidase